VADLLDLDGMNYEIRQLGDKKRFTFQLPGRLKYFRSVMNQLVDIRDLYLGDSRARDAGDADVFLQMAPEVGLPRGWRLKKVLVLYDLIPYALESDYLWSYATARANDFNRLAALRCAMRRRLYKYKMRAVCRRADVLLAISEKTKQDFVRYMSVKSKKIRVTPLGIDGPDAKTDSRPPSHRYADTSWGYIRRHSEFDQKTPYILFVGGADPRRKLDDLVAAFNLLRGEGHDLKLVLAGNTMRGPKDIPIKNTQSALAGSSYTDGIVFLGFVTDSERDWLYENALAFVFPSKYEGFGLPVLEAMRYKTPVITYKNSSIPEAAGNAALYAGSYLDVMKCVKQLIEDPKLRDKYAKLGQAQTAKFSWSKTSRNIIETVTE
jgi:glycosyltransferase involved in cell wall biosynthesis